MPPHRQPEAPSTPRPPPSQMPPYPPISHISPARQLTYPRLYLLGVLLNAVNLFLQVFFTIMYSDLECDYINPIDLCNRLNMYIVPEAGVHAFLTILFLVNGYWIPTILNLPLLIWNGKKYVHIMLHHMHPPPLYRSFVIVKRRVS